MKNNSRKKTNNKVKNNEKKLEFPTLTIILMILFGIPGFISYYSASSTLKSCTGVTTGIVERVELKNYYDYDRSVESKYVGNGKGERHQIMICVDTDKRFKFETLYASVAYGNEGDKLTIHYNPDDPDEYYIGDIKKLGVFWATAVLLSLSGLMLILSAYLTYSFNTEKENDEEKEKEKVRKQEEKKKKQEDKRKQAEEKLEQSTKRYTKNYTNSHIRDHIKSSVLDSRITLYILIFGAALFLSAFVGPVINLLTEHSIPFNNYSDNIDDTMYSVVIEEIPTEVYSKDRSVFFDLKSGNDHILVSNVNKSKITEFNGSLKLRGRIRRIGVTRKEIREVIREYYQSTGYLENLKDEEFAYYYLDCSKINLWEEVKSKHPIILVFGLTFIIIALFFSPSFIYTLKNIRPACSGRRYKAEEIDKLANDKDTVWLSDIAVLATPSALIGLNRGLTVVDYSDISGIKVESNHHKSKYRKWTTYRIIIETNNNRKMLLSECESQYGYKSLTNCLDKKSVKYKTLNIQ